MTLFLPRVSTLADASADIAASVPVDGAALASQLLGLFVFGMLGADALGFYLFDRPGLLRAIMKKRAWLLLAAALLCLSAFLMSRGDSREAPAGPTKVAFPRRAKPEEQERSQRRRTLPPEALTADGGATEQQRRDPLLWALPPNRKASVVVFEVAELKDSPVGQAWLDCMLARGGEAKGRASFQERFGIDPLEDVERVAVSSERVAVLSVTSGAARFDRIGWPSGPSATRAWFTRARPAPG